MLEKFLITNKNFYNNIDSNLSYAKNLGVNKLYLRDKNLNLEILKAFKESCDKYNIRIFINYIPRFLSYNTDGIHLKSTELHLIINIKNLANSYKISYSAHNFSDIQKAYDMGVDYIFISPIFFVKDKGIPLGVEFIDKIPLYMRSKIFALGGINKYNINKLQNLKIRGIAGIRMFLQ
ncbi:MAG: thiamine phosphate synthase [Helicobacteraceae bacterium]|nr:thiamine phosphate synthase [Helicobacteraceae bacterium]